jgi:hypothetical protein
MVDIATWEDDPGQAGEGRQPITVEGPDLAGLALPVEIDGPAVAPDVYDQGTAEFRYWVAAEAVARGVTYWAPLLPDGTTWSVTGGGSLVVKPDAGVDLNAYYDRETLSFFHFPDEDPTVFSGESPEVVCHELGHAVLDAIKPELWDTSFIEPVGFHEAFGDMSAVLSVLQNDEYREFIAGNVLALNHYSRLSRTAEQLGAGLRALLPHVVEPECLRCLANSWFYQEPANLPPMAPAWLLSSEPHSFSRVFSGAFLGGLAGMVEGPGGDAIAAATQDMGKLLVAGVVAAPVVPSFYAEVAYAMLLSDQETFGGKYLQPLASAFVRHGVLALTAQGEIVRPDGAPALGVMTVGDAENHVVISGADVGLSRDVHVPLPTMARTAGTASSDVDFGPVAPPTATYAARAFVEDLFRRQRVQVAQEVRAPSFGVVPAAPTSVRPTKFTHTLAEEDGMLVLRRLIFDCHG